MIHPLRECGPASRPCLRLGTYRNPRMADFIGCHEITRKDGGNEAAGRSPRRSREWASIFPPSTFSAKLEKLVLFPLASAFRGRYGGGCFGKLGNAIAGTKGPP